MKDRLLRARRYWPALVLAAVYFLFGFLNHHPAGFGHRDGRFEFAWPSATSGDEPHYLVIVHSIVFDGDIRIDPDFARITAGGFQGGIRWRGQKLGGHSILVDPRTGRHTTCRDFCEERDAAIVGAPLDGLVQYPAHPVGFPAFLALLLLPFRLSPESIEPAAGIIGILVSIAGVILTYAAARKSGLASKHALAAAALLGFASSWLPYVKAYFSESAIGVFVLAGYVALRSRKPILSGAMIAVAMAMKPLFILFGFAWIAERAARRQFREAIFLTASIGACGLVLVAFNMATIRQIVTTGTVPFMVAAGLTSLYDTFFHETQGLLLYVPWAIVPLVWGLVACRPGARDREGLVSVEARRQMMPSILLCGASFAIVAWGPGFCYGPRYWVPLMPFLAILTIDFVLAGTKIRAYALALPVVASFVLAVAGGLQYNELFSRKPHVALFGVPPE